MKFRFKVIGKIRLDIEQESNKDIQTDKREDRQKTKLKGERCRQKRRHAKEETRLKFFRIQNFFFSSFFFNIITISFLFIFFFFFFFFVAFFFLT